MTPNAMIAHLASMAGNFGTRVDSQILVELQNAQIELEGLETLPFQLLKEKYASTTADEPRVQVPTDFIKEYEESALWYKDSDGVFHGLCKGHQDDNRGGWNRDGYTDSDTEGPKAYSIIGGYFYVYPTPSDSYTLQMVYYAKDSTLAVDGAANLWSTNYPDLIMGIAGRNLLAHSGHLFEEKVTLLGRFDQMAKDGLRRLITSNVAREMANMELSYGGG